MSRYRGRATAISRDGNMRYSTALPSAMITTQTLLYLPTVGGRFPSARLTYETPSQLTDAIQSAVTGV